MTVSVYAQKGKSSVMRIRIRRSRTEAIAAGVGSSLSSLRSAEIEPSWLIFATRGFCRSFIGRNCIGMEWSMMFTCTLSPMLPCPVMGLKYLFSSFCRRLFSWSICSAMLMLFIFLLYCACGDVRC